MPETTSQMVRITIDGMTVHVPKGTLVIEAARRVGVMIPHFCYHPKLKPAIIINEYVGIAAEFFDAPETGFINGVLQEISTSLRAA